MFTVKRRILIVTVALFLVSVGLVSAQVIPPVGVGERVLVNITSAGQSFAYTFDNEAESDTTISVTYIGQPFPLLTEWYDSSGTLLGTVAVSTAGPAQSLRLPPDDILIFISAGGSATGRAMFSLQVDAPANAMPSFGSDAPDDEMIGEPPEDMVGPGELIVDDSVFAGTPASGDWTLTYIDHTNTCPNDILFENIWMPANGSTHPLAFSGLHENVALELHQMVVSEEIAAEPTFFETSTGDEANSWIVLPGIQTAPYEYRYTISAADVVQVEYIERLALSDCELNARYELARASADAGNLPMPVNGAFADLSNWGTVGDATAPTFETDAFAPDGMLCATDLTDGFTWYFEASPEFIAEIQTGYGATLEFYLRLGNSGSIYEDYDVMLTVGNGIILVYDLGDTPTTDWTYFQFPLMAGAGWVDIDGMFTTDDPALFEQMLADVSQLHIRGEYITGADSACIANVALTQ